MEYDSDLNKPVESMDVENNNFSTNSTNAEASKLYRSILIELDQIEDNQIHNDAEDTALQLDNIVQQVHAIETESNVVDFDVAVLGSMVLSSTTALLSTCISSINMSPVKYNEENFISKLKLFLSKDTEDDDISEKLAFYANKLIFDVVKYNSIATAFTPETVPPARQQRERAAKQRNSLQKKEPTKFTQKEEQEAISIENYVQDYLALLNQEYERNGRNPIKYYDFVIDSECFNKTVENILYTAFLVRDGSIVVDLESSHPYIKPVEKNQARNDANDGRNHQIITAFSYKKWMVRYQFAMSSALFRYFGIVIKYLIAESYFCQPLKY